MTAAFPQKAEDIFTFPFTNKKSSSKFMIAVLLLLGSFVIPVLPIFVLSGYMLELRRWVATENSLELPEWNNWGKYFVDGAKTFLISLLFQLPVLLMMVIGFAVVFIPGLVLISDAASLESTPQIVLVTSALGLGGVIGLGITIILWVVVGFMLPAALTHFAVKGQVKAAFRIGEWWPVMRNNFSDFLIAYIMLIVIGILLALIIQILSLTVVLCALIPLLQSLIMVYTMFLSTALFAKAYRGGLEKSRMKDKDWVEQDESIIYTV